MEESKLYTARVQVVEAMEQGRSWQEARQEAGLLSEPLNCLSTPPAGVLHLGAEAAQDGRHGHPVKVRGEVREWLEETCRQAPHMPSHQIQARLSERFALSVSVSQLNRVRAASGLSNPPHSAKKK